MTLTCSAPASNPLASPLNRLASQKSPYLLQHADNPVDWYPWGAEAFARARQENRPIFLSVGYATCHWCHVMEHESFVDPEVARLMNETFVNIKVDREERPDIDQVYMTVCQMLVGRGGWPLTIIMTPDKEPFFAATYLPRTSRHGQIGMIELVPKVAQAWADSQDQVLTSARGIVSQLRQIAGPQRAGPAQPNLAARAYEELATSFDKDHGGFGQAPKFPSPHNLIFLMRYWQRTGEDRALAMAEKTLDVMRRGGIYDQVGFGFHRYATDRKWLIPHFEKMLYDQAMLSLAYTEAYLASDGTRHAATIREVLDYVLRDMTAPEGGFYSAEDADSEGEEGRFYMWSTDQLEEVLGKEEARLVAAAFNLTGAGNYRDQASGQPTGTNILHRPDPLTSTAQRLGLAPEVFESRLETSRARLFATRKQRVHPFKDDKVLADWNGLMAAALARAGRALGVDEYVLAAERAVQFVSEQMMTAEGGLYHRYRDGEVSVPGFLDDYAFLTWARLELYDATLDPAHLAAALTLLQTTIDRFAEPAGGFYFSANDSETLLVRPLEVHDGAIPSGNSVALTNLVRLALLTGRSDLSERADQLACAFAPQLGRSPANHSHLLAGMLMAQHSLELVIAGDPAAANTQSLIAAARSVYAPFSVLMLVPSGKAGDQIRSLAPFTAHIKPINGAATAYLCRGFQCAQPTSDPAQLVKMLREGESS